MDLYRPTPAMHVEYVQFLQFISGHTIYYSNLWEKHNPLHVFLTIEKQMKW